MAQRFSAPIVGSRSIIPRSYEPMGGWRYHTASYSATLEWTTPPWLSGWGMEIGSHLPLRWAGQWRKRFTQSIPVGGDCAYVVPRFIKATYQYIDQVGVEKFKDHWIDELSWLDHYINTSEVPITAVIWAGERLWVGAFRACGQRQAAYPRMADWLIKQLRHCPKPSYEPWGGP